MIQALGVVALLLLLTSCQAQQQPTAGDVGAVHGPALATTTSKLPDIIVTSPAFKANDVIPVRYTCGGSNISPALSWTGVPKAAAALLLLCQDPDAPSGTFTHWAVFNIPAGTAGVKENVRPEDPFPGGGIQGTNSRRTVGYTGPCPPPGKVHHYHFTVYALDAPLAVTSQSTGPEALLQVNQHMLAVGELIGTYER